MLGLGLYLAFDGWSIAIIGTLAHWHTHRIIQHTVIQYIDREDERLFDASVLVFQGYLADILDQLFECK